MSVSVGNLSCLRRKASVFLIFTVTLSSFITFIRYSGVGLPYEVCSPKINILFLKTHKTAGSTLQNVFMRYAARHHLLLVLPLQGNYLGHPSKFQTSMAPNLLPGYTYNIFTHHARFNYEPMRRLMPADTVFVTILRDPVTLFDSLYEYYGLNSTFHLNITSFAYLNVTDDVSRRLLDVRYLNKIGRNQLAFDLGIDVELFDDDEAILRAVKRLDKQFHLVMIAEMINESLVLLKNELCVDLDDVVAFKHNVRTDVNKKRLSSDVGQKLRRINRADQLIYDYFYWRLIERIKVLGADRMALEVTELRRRTDQWYRRCIAADNINRSIAKDDRFRVLSYKVKGFQLKDEEFGNKNCENMAKAELPFTEELLSKQISSLENASKPLRK